MSQTGVERTTSHPEHTRVTSEHLSLDHFTSFYNKCYDTTTKGLHVLYRITRVIEF